jgi:hypothetical protein
MQKLIECDNFILASDTNILPIQGYLEEYKGSSDKKDVYVAHHDESKLTWIYYTREQVTPVIGSKIVKQGISDDGNKITLLLLSTYAVIRINDNYILVYVKGEGISVRLLPDEQSVTEFIPPDSCSYIVSDPPAPSEEYIEKIEQCVKFYREN